MNFLCPVIIEALNAIVPQTANDSLEKISFKGLISLLFKGA
jgi:hypothetical protein